MCNLSYKLVVCVVLSISLVFGFYQKTEVKNRNRTSWFFIFEKTDRFLMSKKPKFFKTKKPNRSLKKPNAQPYKFGKVVAKYVGGKHKGSKTCVWVPKVLVSNAKGPKTVWVPKIKN
jgi:hypothetical protein